MHTPHRLSSRKAVRDLLVQYLGSVQAVPVRSGFAPHATPDLALGDSDEEPTNVFLIVEVGIGVVVGWAAAYKTLTQVNGADQILMKYCPAQRAVVISQDGVAGLSPLACLLPAAFATRVPLTHGRLGCGCTVP